MRKIAILLAAALITSSPVLMTVPTESFAATTAKKGKVGLEGGMRGKSTKVKKGRSAGMRGKGVADPTGHRGPGSTFPTEHHTK